MRSEAFFARYPRRSHGFTDDSGRAHTFLFPTYFRRSAACLAVFPCNAARAADLTGAGLRPARLSPTRALIAFACYEHSDIAEMPGYREAVIAIPVMHKPFWNPPLLPLVARGLSRRFGQYIWRMPVTSELNRTRGRSLWGLPKEMAEISMTRSGLGMTAGSSEDGKPLFSLRVEAGGPERMMDQKMRFFSIRDGRLFEAFTHVRGRTRTARNMTGLGRKACKAALTLGDSPSARILAGLDIGISPVEVRTSDSLMSVLTLPEEI